jgi:hypothetical protein
MGAKEMEKREKKEKGRGKREHYVRKTTPCNIMKITDTANPLFESSYNIITQCDICTI